MPWPCRASYPLRSLPSPGPSRARYPSGPAHAGRASGPGDGRAAGRPGCAPAVGPPLGPLVGEDLAHDVAARNAGDPAAAMGGRAGLVKAPDRGAQVRVARSGPGVAHLAERQLAVEDVPAHQAVLLLHLVWPDHLAVQ